MTTDIPCNCFHPREDHKQFSADDRIANDFYSWCRYSEIGQCPCDAFTLMDNLAYLEWKVVECDTSV